MNRYDAVVVGGGPSGATAALTLARAGLRVAAVEKARFPRAKVCGEFVSATTWPLLRELGVGHALLAAAGPPVRRVGLFAGSAMVDSAMPTPAHGDSWGRALGRDVLDGALLDKAASTGVHVLQPRRVIGWEDRGGEFRVALDGGTTLHARVLLAAHGSWEKPPAGGQEAGDAHAESDLLGFKAHFHGARLDAGLMPLLLFPGGYGGLVHSDAGRVSFSCCIRRDALRRCRAQHPGLSAGEAVLEHAMASSRGVAQALAGAKRESGWLSAGPIRPGLRRLVSGRIFTVGNAAGEAHPLVAEGISMAIQSGWLAGESIAAAPGLSDEALRHASQGYAQRWNDQFARRVRASAAFAALTTRGLPAAASIAVMRRAPAILTWGARFAGKGDALRSARAMP